MDWLMNLLNLSGGGSDPVTGALGGAMNSGGGESNRGMGSMLNPMSLFGGNQSKATNTNTFTQVPPKISGPQFGEMGLSPMAASLLLQSPMGSRLMLGQQQ